MPLDKLLLLPRYIPVIDITIIYSEVKPQAQSYSSDGRILALKVDDTWWVLEDFVKSILKQKAKANKKSSTAKTKNGTVKSKGRARPRKDRVSNDSSDQGNTAPEAKVSSSTLANGAPGEETLVPSEGAIPRRRGRPAKNPIAADSSDQGNTAPEDHTGEAAAPSGAPDEKTSDPSEGAKPEAVGEAKKESDPS
ncbi:MAG: hypothetical protein LBF22_14880 [Deltaproteobacteria bacterium]|nr:hypothetical protein [Deltaproteobacteria bacterium]